MATACSSIHRALTSPLAVVTSASQNGTAVPDICHALSCFCSGTRSHCLVRRNVRLSVVSGAYLQVIVTGNHSQKNSAIVFAVA
jgi:hypothetical protein